MVKVKFSKECSEVYVANKEVMVECIYANTVQDEPRQEPAGHVVSLNNQHVDTSLPKPSSQNKTGDAGTNDYYICS